VPSSTKADDIGGRPPYVCGESCIGLKSVSISESTMQAGNKC